MSRPDCLLRDERGSATLEFVLWIPIFMTLLIVMVDVSMFYLSQTRMQNVARDAARRMSIGELAPADVSTFVGGQLAGDGYAVTDCSTGSDSCVRIGRTADATFVFGGVFKAVAGEQFFVQTTMRDERDVAPAPLASPGA